MNSSQSPEGQDFFKASADSCLVLDASFKIVAVNPSYLQAKNTKREEILGRNFFEVFSDNSKQDLKQAVEVVLRKESEERLTIALSAAKMGTFDWRSESQAPFWSEQTERLFGLEPGEFRGTFEHARELVFLEDFARVKEVLINSVANGQDFQFEFRVFWPKNSSSRNEKIHWLYAYGRTLLDPVLQSSRLIGTIIDITARKNAESELTNHTHLLQTLNHLGQRFSAELDLHKLVESVTDAATKLVKARILGLEFPLKTSAGFLIVSKESVHLKMWEAWDSDFSLPDKSWRPTEEPFQSRAY